MNIYYKVRFSSLALVLIATAMVILSGCRGDELIAYSEDEDTGGEAVKTNIVGMYVLNEGNMGSNKCTLDYLDLSANTPTVHYTRNIYAERNPSEVKELGDVGNDIQIYGSRLWAVINASNKVEVADAYTCKKIGKVDIPNCRYVVFDKGYAYISSYAGPLALGGKAQLGRIYKVDTLSLQKIDSLTVGYQPEEMCIVDGKLYVANSGGYLSTGSYDHTVSQVDLQTFREERKIDVAINLHRCRTDKYGQVWVTSRGNYKPGTASVPSRLFWLEKSKGGSMEKADSLDITVSDLCIVGDSLFFIGVDNTDTQSNGTQSFGIVNVRTHQVVASSLSPSPEAAAIKLPYGIIVNPINKDFYIMDAKDFVSSGELLHFKADGSFDWKVRTGDIPAHAAFVRERINQEQQ